MACLDRQTAADFVEGNLSPEETLEIEGHLSDCPDCRALLVKASKASLQRNRPRRSGDITADDPVTSDHSRNRYLEHTADRHEPTNHANVVHGHARPAAVKASYELNRKLQREAEKVSSGSGTPRRSLSLEDLVAKGGLPVEQVLALMDQICEQVRTVHREGLFHRDLKLSGVSVDRSGRQARVLGFDLVRDADVREGGSLAGQGVDSNGEPPSRRSEILALGVIAYRLLGGRLPHGLGKDALNAIPRRFRPVIARCLDVPEARYGSVRAFKQALHEADEAPAIPLPKFSFGGVAFAGVSLGLALVFVVLLYSGGSPAKSSGIGAGLSMMGSSSVGATSGGLGIEGGTGSLGGTSGGGFGTPSGPSGWKGTTTGSGGAAGTKFDTGKGGSKFDRPGESLGTSTRGESLSDMSQRLDALESDLKSGKIADDMSAKMLEEAKAAIRRKDPVAAGEALASLENKLKGSQTDRVTIQLDKIANLAGRVQLDPAGAAMLADTLNQVRTALKSGDLEAADAHLEQIQNALTNAAERAGKR